VVVGVPIPNHVERPPVIIMGMHRSGTSMITKFLKDLGLFVGWALDGNYEALFFRERNEKVLNECNGTWDNPTVIYQLLSHASMRGEVAKVLSKDLMSFRAFSYLGPRYLIQYRSVFNIDSPWGWKDPRNTVLMPIWHDIFPEARIIHVYRNGIDVAASLCERDRKRKAGTYFNNEAHLSFPVRQFRLFKKRKILLHMLFLLYSLNDRLNSAHKDTDKGVQPCLSLEKGCALWSVYMEMAFRFTSDIKENVIHIKFEDFLSEPAYYINKLRVFCDLPDNHHKIKHLVDSVVPNRKYAFKNNASLRVLYSNMKDDFWMNKLGYVDEL
jgi:hypothetical protein